MSIEKVYRVEISYDIPDWNHGIDFDKLVEQFDSEIVTYFSGGAACFPYIVIEGPTRRDVEEAYEECVAEIKKVGGELK